MILYLIVVLLLAVFVLGIWLSRSWKHDVVGFALKTTCGCILGILFLFWLVSYVESVQFVQEFRATKMTVDQSRSDPNISVLERTMLTEKIIEANVELAGMKYWNSTILDPMYADEVVDLHPIE